MSLPPGQRSAHPSPEWGVSSQASPDFPGQQRNPTTATALPPTPTPGSGGGLCCQHSQGQEIVRGHGVGSLRSRHERQSTRPRPQAQGKGDAGAHVTRRAEARPVLGGPLRRRQPLPLSGRTKPLHGTACHVVQRGSRTLELTHDSQPYQASLQTLAFGPNSDPSVSAHVSPTHRPQAFQLQPSWAAAAPLTAKPK